MRRVALALALALTLPTTAHAQQGASDVGGQPAKRRITKYPKLVKFVEAEWPKDQHEAHVVLELDVSATGQVTAARVVKSEGADYDAAAAAAAKQFEFEPAEVDGKPAPSRITYRYDFVLRAPEHVQTAPIPPPPPPPPPPSPTEPPEVEIRGRPHERRETMQTRVSAEEGKRVAGTQGDVLKVVQNLPGVSRPPVASGQIVVWGSAPRETKTYVDGVEIPALYHGSGLRSTLSSDLVAGVDLVPGAYGPEHGRALGGLVRVETRALPRGTHAIVSADTLDGSALVSTELGKDARIAISGRQSWLDRVLSVTSAPDASDFFPIPRYRDAQVKATLDLRKNEAIDTVFLYSHDDLTRSVPSQDPAKTRSEATTSGFWRAYARYTNVTEGGDTMIVTPFVGHDDSELVQRFGQTPARLAVSSDVYGARATLRSKLHSHVTLVTGVDALGTSSDLSREGSLTLPPREGDIAVFGQPPGDEYNQDAWSTNIVDVGPHAYADVRLGPVTITPGIRFDAFLIEGNRQTPRVGETPAIGFSRLESAFDPRGSARWDVTSRLALTAAAGTYHQTPDPEDLSAVFGTPALGLSKATHYSAGESLRITDSLTLEAVAFQKSLQDLVVRSRLANPLLARALVQNGEGRSYGVQFLLREELWKGFFGWVSYAISRSERRYEGDAAWRLFDYDQPHVLAVVASQEVSRFGFGARFRYASGNPRTPVVASYYDARADDFDPVFGAQNSIRIPAFWALDLRADYTIPLGASRRVLVFADVQNVTNHANAEEIVYSADFSRRDVIRGLPTIAVVGARLEL
ncbi:MAG TPA: TonB-dependent receptor [Labilithrix sp.]